MTMKTVDVKLGDRYQIAIGHSTLAKLGAAVKALNIGQDAVVITNPGIRRLHGQVLSAGLKKAGMSVKFLEVPDGEQSKSAGVALDLIDAIAPYAVNRKVFIIAFGGGVIGDLAGFVAAIYKRGVPLVQVPTTLLAQIDSAIGGKVGVDLPVGKNLIGAFYQPRLVWSDVNLLSTLDERQIRNGLAEAVKYGVICDKRLFDFIGAHVEDLLVRKPQILTEVVWNCSQIKAKVVMSDEKETRGLRTVLNFGHTVGHAVEAAASYNRYHHGEAVALGMRVAADISCQMSLMPKKAAQEIGVVLSRIGLPEKIEGVTLTQILKTMRHDKKFVGNKNRFVLAARVGSVKVVDHVPLDTIKAAIKRFLV